MSICPSDLTRSRASKLLLVIRMMCVFLAIQPGLGSRMRTDRHIEALTHQEFYPLAHDWVLVLWFVVFLLFIPRCFNVNLCKSISVSAAIL